MYFKHLRINLAVWSKRMVFYPSYVDIGEVSESKLINPEYCRKPCPPQALLKIYMPVIVSLVKIAFNPLEIAWASFKPVNIPFLAS
jgi:hypothetical protein